MDSKKKTAASLAAITGLSGLIFGGVAMKPATAQAPTPPIPGAPNAPGARRERHPELRRALATLERVETQLRRSARDFGGHREKAADLCRQAEAEIQLALQSDKQ